MLYCASDLKAPDRAAVSTRFFTKGRPMKKMILATAIMLAALPAAAQDMDPNTQRYYAYPQPLPRAGEIVRVQAEPLTVHATPRAAPQGGMVASATPDAYAYEPKKAVDDAPTRKNDLRTKTGIEIGAQFSTYHYQEPDLNVKLDALKYGINPILTASLYGNWFVKADGRFAMGSADYEGSGTSKDHADYISEIRAVAGYDFMFGGFALSPYAGLGYRYLYNDLRGFSSTGASGYRRNSHYLYMPVGVNPRFRVGDTDQIAMTFEYDQLLTGRQFSQLSDVSGYPDLDNDQNAGFGLRGEVMYQWPRWSFGPFFNYWNINQSETVCATGGVGTICGVEPHNQTYEFGVQLRYRVF